MKATLIFLSVVLLFTSCTKYIEVNPARSSAMASCDSIHEPPPDTIPVHSSDTTRIAISIIGQSLVVYKYWGVTDIVIPDGIATAFRGTWGSGNMVDWNQLYTTAQALAGPPTASLLTKDEATWIPPFILRFNQLTNRKLAMNGYMLSGTILGDSLLTIRGQQFGLNWGTRRTKQVDGKDWPLYSWWKTNTLLALQKMGWTADSLKIVLLDVAYSDPGSGNPPFTDAHKKASFWDLQSLVNRIHSDFPNAVVNHVKPYRADGQNASGFAAVRANMDSLATIDPKYTTVESPLGTFPYNATYMNNIGTPNNSVDGQHPSVYGSDQIGPAVAEGVYNNPKNHL